MPAPPPAPRPSTNVERSRRRRRRYARQPRQRHFDIGAYEVGPAGATITGTVFEDADFAGTAAD